MLSSYKIRWSRKCIRRCIRWSCVLQTLNWTICLLKGTIMQIYLQDSDSEFYISSIKLIYKFFYPLDSVWHGHCVRSGLKIIYQLEVSCWFKANREEEDSEQGQDTVHHQPAFVFPEQVVSRFAASVSYPRVPVGIN